MPQKRPRKSTTSKNPNAGEYRRVRPTCPPKTSAQRAAQRAAHQTPGSTEETSISLPLIRKQPRNSTTFNDPNAGEYKRDPNAPLTKPQAPQRTRRSRYPLLESNLNSQPHPIISTLVSSDASPQCISQYATQEASGSILATARPLVLYR